MEKVCPLLIISLLVLGSFKTAQAASYYVDYASGSDSNSGTSSAPWKTLGKVNAVTFQPGDTINFKRGATWPAGQLTIGNNGTTSSPIIYQAYGTGNAPSLSNGTTPGSYTHVVHITGDWIVFKDFKITGGHEAGIFLTSTADHNVIRDNEVTGSGVGIYVLGPSNHITHNYVHDLGMVVNDSTPNTDYGSDCIWIEHNDNEVSYNTAVNCIAPSIDFGFDGGCVTINNKGDNTHIHHNFCKNTEGFTEIGGQQSSAVSANNVLIHHNIVITANGAMCLHESGQFAIPINNLKFEHNTVVTTGTHGFRMFSCRGDLSPLQIRNNIFYSNIQIANSAPGIHTNNLYYMVNMISGSGVGYTIGSGEKTGNPLFVNDGTGDLHLQSGSPAIDAGISAGYSTDYEDKIVPIGSAPDMGAYEYGGAITLSPPQNLRVTSQ